MAEEQQEDIIIIEDSDAAYESAPSKYSTQEYQEPSTNKKLLLIIGVSAITIIVVILMSIFLSDKQKEDKDPNMDYIEDRLDKKTKKIIEPTKIENMIAKANYLYTTGSKNEALSLFQKIAQYNEAVSAYNLGVAQLKDEQYETALQSFQKAINNNEKRCVSAINAAVCSLHLNNEKSFRYYIDLAYAYLPYQRDSKLYSYYYTLINYYNKNYLEVLSSLNNPTSSEYSKTKNNIAARVNALFGNDYNALENVEQNKNPTDDFSLGLLYSRVGDLTLAKEYLSSAIKKNIEPVKAQIALGYVKLKAGQVQDASKEIDNATDMFGEEVYKPYPIKVTLKESLFDYTKAQKRYRDKTLGSKEVIYQKIFYFSPYKIFNANKTISYIQKGNANIFVNNVDSAKTYLKKSETVSNVNVGIVRAIQKALKFKIRESNNILKSLVKIQPKHSILQYNLALTYAQMNNMVKAHEHFVRSYNLDAKNYLSGIYAVMTSQLINEESRKMLSILKDSISLETESEDIDLYKTLIFIAQGNIISTVDWLDNKHPETPLYLALNIIIAIQHENFDAAKKAANKLTMLLPNEILPHIMNIDASFNKLETKQYAREVLNYLKIQKFDFNDLYFGPYITRYLYTQQNLITGKLYFLREQLKKVLEATTHNTHELTSSLALASLYDQAFEESYTLYNNLIDNLKVRDPHTLFLAAVASTAAGHHENAIALLELAKMKDRNNLDSRYALGLLYLEVKNNKGAVIQLSKIYKKNFNSAYFNFNIDLEKLMFEKLNPKG